jgi:hypothetical protein
VKRYGKYGRKESNCPYLFTIQLFDLPYFPNHFTFQLTFLPYFQYLFTKDMANMEERGAE